MTLERRPREWATRSSGAVISGALLLGAAVTGVWLRLGLPLPVCSLKAWTGFPCVTCGSTRMVEAVLSGEVVDAATWNPLVFAAIAAIAVVAAGSAVRAAFGLPAWRVVLARRERIALVVLVAAALVGNWGYLIWRGV